MQYEVLPSPAQRVKSGTESPSVFSSNTTDFAKYSKSSPAKFLNQSGNTSNAIFEVADLNFNDVFYLWIEREVKKGVRNFDSNDCVFNIKYKESN
jgi:hypothetical protein